MSNRYIFVKQSLNLNGQAELFGAKNATLPIMASLILTSGKSKLFNVPNSSDVQQMIFLLKDLGAKIKFDERKKIIEADTSKIKNYEVNPEIMNKMRASILVMGPLLAKLQIAKVASPGGCLIGTRPIDLHIDGFKKMGITIEQDGHFYNAKNTNPAESKNRRIILPYPSVGATENLVMLATLTNGKTTIINAALEPEVLDFLEVLKKMGAKIKLEVPNNIIITGVKKLKTIEHDIIPDRLEAGALLLAAAITGGKIHLPNARYDHMDIFLEKLKEMGHKISIENGIKLEATDNPIAVNFKTGPYPGFPTDLQAPMMVAQCLAKGTSIVEETVFENRLMHVKELEKMGAQIKINGNKALINGVDELYGTDVIATDIRASCALVLAGLVAQNHTKILGISHWRRGYDKFEEKLNNLGCNIKIIKN